MFKGGIIHVLIKDSLWTIKLVRAVPGKDRRCLGLCDYDARIIYIKKSMPAEKVLEILCHEYFHALSHEYEFKISHKLIYRMQKPIAQLLLDNYL